MLKGMIQISKDIRYRIFAIEKQDAAHGEILADVDLEELGSRVIIYKGGIVAISNPDHKMTYDLKNGRMEFE